MTPIKKHTHSPVIGQAEAQATFQQMVQHQIRQAIRATFIDILEDEVIKARLYLTQIANRN